jgi:hypothetical protein
MDVRRSAECSTCLKCIGRQIGCEGKILRNKLYGKLVVRGKYCTINQNKTLRTLSRPAPSGDVAQNTPRGSCSQFQFRKSIGRKAHPFFGRITFKFARVFPPFLKNKRTSTARQFPVQIVAAISRAPSSCITTCVVACVFLPPHRVHTLSGVKANKGRRKHIKRRILLPNGPAGNGIYPYKEVTD